MKKILLLLSLCLLGLAGTAQTLNLELWVTIDACDEKAYMEKWGKPDWFGDGSYSTVAEFHYSDNLADFSCKYFYYSNGVFHVQMHNEGFKEGEPDSHIFYYVNTGSDIRDNLCAYYRESEKLQANCFDLLELQPDMLKAWGHCSAQLLLANEF